ncbi:reverse transcriptase domain-containing protein [Tanacetum coccineum]
MPHEITKIVRRANETLPAFKERWTVETGLIMGVSEDEFVRAEEAYARTELPPGESRDIHRRLSLLAGPRDVHQRLTFQTSTRSDRDNRSSQRRDYKGNDYKNPYKVRDNFNGGRHRDYRAPYPQRDQANKTVPVLSLDSLIKCPKEILATETQLQLPAPRPVANPLRTGDPDKYCDYHQDKGHHTNDCIRLRKQLEISLKLREGKQILTEKQPEIHEARQPDERADLTEQILVNPSFPDQIVTIGGRLSTVCKDYYPLPSIDCKVEAVMGFKYKCFLDAYKGYHQVQMAREDEEKTSHLTQSKDIQQHEDAIGLKNAGATYQRIVLLYVQSQIGRNLEAYVDDMVIKSKDEKDLLADIAETFKNLKAINMKLNPKKCSFGVEEGKFLGYMVTSEGIRANPKKTKVISDLTSPKTLKKMQSLSGKLASLNRFLAKSAERALPFFNTLKNITKENKHEYRWTPEAEEAFQQMKRLIISLPSLTPAPVPEGDTLAYLYCKGCCLSRKLAKYAVEIGTYKISFIPRNAIKGQVMADFLSDAPDGEAEEEYFRMPEVPPEIDDTEVWTLFTDGAASLKGSGAGLVLIGPSGLEYTYALRLTFVSTNNEAEYEALLAGLRIARKMKVSGIEVKVDSKLVANQINGAYEATKESMIKYLAKAKEFISEFKTFSIENITERDNS